MIEIEIISRNNDGSITIRAKVDVKDWIGIIGSKGE